MKLQTNFFRGYIYGLTVTHIAFFLMISTFSFAQNLIVEKPADVRIGKIGADVVEVKFTWNPSDLWSNSNTDIFQDTKFVLTAVDQATFEEIVTEYLFQSSDAFLPLNDHFFRLPVLNLKPKRDYKVKINVFESINFNLYGRSDDSDWSETIRTKERVYGITVLTHGFQAGGATSGFIDYARQIKERLNGNATIFLNEKDDNFDYWKLVEGNGTGELIFVYEWPEYSWRLSEKDNAQLEYAADKLFQLLTLPLAKSGRPIIKRFDKPGELLKSKQTHFIAHSRGTILNLQVFHRLLEHFPSIDIEQFTALDPHPATTFGDVNSTLNNVNHSLPAVFGFASSCILTCENRNSITFRVPLNVQKAESIYREDNNFEGIDITTINVGQFDGIPITGGVNVKLENDALESAPIAGGAHSGVHQWYFGSVNFNTPLPDDWFNNSALKNRMFGGFFNSRLGGNTTRPESARQRLSISNLNQQIKARQNGRPLDIAFNQSFQYNGTGWDIPKIYNNYSEKEGTYSLENPIENERLKIRIDEFDIKNNNRTKTIKKHHFYIPKGKNYLSFKIKPTELSKGSSIYVDWFGANDNSFAADGPQCLEEDDEDPEKEILLFSKIPEQLIGQIARFEVIINFTGENDEILVDDFEFGKTEPAGGQGIGDGYCCEDEITENFDVTANASGKYVDPTTGKVIVCPGTNVTLSSSSCSGPVVWSTGDTASYISVDKSGTYHAKCMYTDSCSKDKPITIEFETATKPSIAYAGSDIHACEQEVFKLQARKPQFGYGSWIVSNSGDYSISNIYDPNATFNSNGGNYLLTWKVQLNCSFNSSSDDVLVTVNSNPESFTIPVKDFVQERLIDRGTGAIIVPHSCNAYFDGKVYSTEERNAKCLINIPTDIGLDITFSNLTRENYNVNGQLFHMFSSPELPEDRTYMTIYGETFYSLKGSGAYHLQFSNKVEGCGGGSTENITITIKDKVGDYLSN